MVWVGAAAVADILGERSVVPVEGGKKQQGLVAVAPVQGIVEVAVVAPAEQLWLRRLFAFPT